TIDESVQSALEKEKDPNKRQVAEKLYGAILPTLKAGELDAAVELRGPTANKHYAAIAAPKLKDGQKGGKVLRDPREQVPQAERDKIKLDAESAGSIKIHRLDVHQQFDEQAKKLLGDNPIYIAFRNDALFLTGGEGGLSLLQNSLTSKPGIMPPFKLNLSIAR